MQRRILLNHDWKHWRQSLSSVHRTPLGILQPRLQVLKTTSQAVGPSPQGIERGCQVSTVRRMGQQLHRIPPQKIHCQMGGMGIGIFIVQQNAPQSSSWVLFSQFLGNLWEGNCGVPLCSHCPLMLKRYCCHMTTCSKESEHHFLPNTFCPLHFRSITIREPPD